MCCYHFGLSKHKNIRYFVINFTIPNILLFQSNPYNCCKYLNMHSNHWCVFWLDSVSTSKLCTDIIPRKSQMLVYHRFQSFAHLLYKYVFWKPSRKLVFQNPMAVFTFVRNWLFCPSPWKGKSPWNDRQIFCPLIVKCRSANS